MEGLLEGLAELAGVVAMVFVAIVIWVVVNFARAILQVIFPHEDFAYWSLF